LPGAFVVDEELTTALEPPATVAFEGLLLWLVTAELARRSRL
jgi:hypothetical protein